MIENIMTRGLWAESLTKAPDTRTVTVYVGESTPRPKVTAQIDLSRLEGSGTAKAYIREYQYQGRFDPEPITQFLEPPLDANDPLGIVKSISQYTFGNAYSVTFAVRVTNMFAYANCSVFIYETTSLTAFLLAPFRFLARLLGP